MALVVPLAFSGTGWEYELEGVNFGFTLSIALGIGALLALDTGKRRADVLACALLTLGLLFSELAVLFAIGIAVGQLIADRSFRWAWLWLGPLVLCGAWWLAYHTQIQSGYDWGRAPKFAADMGGQRGRRAIRPRSPTGPADPPGHPRARRLADRPPPRARP